MSFLQMFSHFLLSPVKGPLQTSHSRIPLCHPTSPLSSHVPFVIPRPFCHPPLVIPAPPLVIPAKAGIQKSPTPREAANVPACLLFINLDSSLHGNDHSDTGNAAPNRPRKRLKQVVTRPDECRQPTI